jgi:hypothetical protein
MLGFTKDTKSKKKAAEARPPSNIRALEAIKTSCGFVSHHHYFFIIASTIIDEPKLLALTVPAYH